MQPLKSRIHRLLRWSEKYTKTDMLYLARGGFWSVVGQTAAVLSTLALAIIVGRYLPKEVYGEYKYVVSIVALLSSFSLTGIGQAVFQSVARGFDGALEEGFWVSLRWSIGVFLGALALAIYYFALHNTTLALGILIGGSLSPFLASANLSSAFLGAKKDFARQAIYFDIIENFIPAGALIATIFILPNPLAIVAVYFLSNTLITFYLYRRTVRLYKPDPSKTDSGTLTYGKHLSAMGILSGIASNLDQILLFHFVGPAELAIYNFATAIPDQTKGPLKALNMMLQAKFASRSDEEIRSSMKNKMLWLTASTIIFIVLYIVIAPYIYGFFFPKYLDAIFYSRIYVIGILYISFNPASAYLAVKKRIREQYISNIALSLLQISLLIAGVLSFGLLGVILARVIYRIVGSFIVYVLYRFAPNYDADDADHESFLSRI